MRHMLLQQGVPGTTWLAVARMQSCVAHGTMLYERATAAFLHLLFICLEELGQVLIACFFDVNSHPCSQGTASCPACSRMLTSASVNRHTCCSTQASMEACLLLAVLSTHCSFHVSLNAATCVVF